jgi:ribosomal protein L11 methyltransferase
LNQSYKIIEVSIPEEYFDTAVGILSLYPIIGIEEKYDSLQISFNRNLWNDAYRADIVSELRNIYPDVSLISETEISERNWNEEWEKNVPAVKISDRIGIVPSWKIDELDTEIKVIIDPKMSFGTGTHESTRLISILLSESVLKQSFWIDAGTGTGVLAIIAAKLGAEKILALDNNDWSIENALDNIRMNNVSDFIEVAISDLSNCQFPESDGIAANLNFHLIIELMQQFYNSLSSRRGILLVSGILITSKIEVIDKAKEIGFKLIKTIEENEWIAFKFQAV